jgi:hypothetical protein
MNVKAVLPVLMLAGCGFGEGAFGERVECAIDGAAALERVCTVEQVRGPQGLTLVIRHPSGGFRRLLVTGDGRGVVTADGAEQAAVSVVSEGLIEVAVAGDRYRLPATLKAAGP